MFKNMQNEYVSQNTSYFGRVLTRKRASLVAQTVKNLPAMQETWIQSLGWGAPAGEGNGYSLQYS